LILSALTFSTVLWARLDNPYIWIVLFVTLAFGLIGFADDFAKVTKQTTKGVSSRVRFLLGLLIAGLAAFAASNFHPPALTDQLAMPFLKDVLLNLGIFFVPFGMIVIVGAANAVNLTDGLDGLAIMPVMIAAATLGVISYVVGNSNFTDYLGVHFVPGTGEILIFCAALIGGGLGFLWYNAPPAAVFMGDTGSRLHQARNSTGHCRGTFRGRGTFRHHPGALLQADRKTRLPDGADPSPLRKERLGRAADCDPVLDHFPDPCADRAGNAEGPLTGRPKRGRENVG
jgi:hypothetical protein